MGKLFYSNRESEVMHIFEQKLAEQDGKPVEQPDFYRMEKTQAEKSKIQVLKTKQKTNDIAGYETLPGYICLRTLS